MGGAEVEAVAVGVASEGISIDSRRARLCGGGEAEAGACCGRGWGAGVGLIEPDSVRFLDERVGGWSSSSSSSSSWSSSVRALKSEGRLVSLSPSNWSRFSERLWTKGGQHAPSWLGQRWRRHHQSRTGRDESHPVCCRRR
jgi:hypothetical protein